MRHIIYAFSSGMAFGDPVYDKIKISDVEHNNPQIPKSTEMPTSSIKFTNTTSDPSPSTKLLGSSDWLLQKLEDLQRRTEQLELNVAEQDTA